MFTRAFTCLILMATSAFADVPELSVHADICAIHRAMTGTLRQGCPEGDTFGQPRSVSHDAVAPDAQAGRGYYVHFAFASGTLTPAYEQHLARLSEVLKGPEMDKLCLKLVGHTDVVGSAPYNMSLSEDRARTVRLYLVGAMGLPDDRVLMDWRGEGEILPGVQGTDPRNRRVEILAKDMVNATCGD